MENESTENLKFGSNSANSENIEAPENTENFNGKAESNNSENLLMIKDSEKSDDSESLSKESSSKKNENEKIFFIKQFLFFCAGLEGRIVKEEAFRVEHSKYITIGLTVLFTSVLATLSGGYTFYTIFFNKFIAVPFGFLWGLIIFNLDRLVILGVKQEEKSERDIAPGLIRIGGIVPRIFLACTIGFLVSEPVKLRIFKPEIDRQHGETLVLAEEGKKRRETREVQNKIEEKIEFSEKEISAKKLEKEKNDTQIDNLRDKLNEEVYGRNGRDPGYGSQAAALKEEIEDEQDENDRIDDDIKSLTKKVNEYQDEITELQKNIVETDKNIEVDTTQVSLLDAMTALHELSSDNRTIFFTSTFVTILFILLELLPIFAKLMLGSGVYELLLNQEREKIQNQNKSFVADLELNTDLNDHFMEVIRKASETRKEIEVSSYNNEIYKSEISLRKALIAEEKWQEGYQEKLNKFRHDTLHKVLRTADEGLVDDIGSISKKFAESLSNEMSSLMNVFNETYTEALDRRMKVVQEQAYEDATFQGANFTDKIGQIRRDSFQESAQKASEKAQKKIEGLSTSIANNISDNISNITNDLETIFTRALNEQSNRHEVNFLREYEQYISSFNARLNQIQEESSSAALNLVGEELNENNIKGLSASIVSSISGNITRMVEDIELAFNEALSQNSKQNEAEYSREYTQKISALKNQITQIREEYLSKILNLTKMTLDNQSSETADELSEQLKLQLRELLGNSSSYSGEDQSDTSRS